MSRYSAHLSLEAIGPDGQQRINNARVVLVGLGGLGCPVAQYLAGSGVGELVICDFDTVAESNLARQLLFSEDDVGRYKTEAAAERLAIINPATGITTITQRVDRESLPGLLAGADMLVDSSDNYGTRLSVNRACIETGVPWIMGSCVRMEGQLMAFEPSDTDRPCYRCVYGSAPDRLEDCPGAGIFAPVAGMVGTSMAHLALAGVAGLELPPDLMLLDARTMQWQRLVSRRNRDCPDCHSPVTPG